MRERPIIFSAPMVLALLAGRKTQTRRILKPWRFVLPSDSSSAGWDYNGAALVRQEGGGTSIFPLPWCPYGVSGDRLWVKESFRLRADQDDKPPSQDYWKSGAWCEATGNGETPSGCGGGIGRLRSSIHMPRWASRIDLELTEVRVQRLQDITDEDAKAEGVLDAPDLGDWAARGIYADLWNRINGAGSWDANPWVWSLTFKVLRPDVAAAKAILARVRP